MAAIYRTAGPWGAGKGSNLSPAEVDANFWYLFGLISTISGDIPDPIEIASITSDGSNIIVTLTDATVHSFAMPRPVQRPTRTKDVTASSYSVIAGDVMTLLRCTNASGCEIVIDDIDVPVDAEFNVWLDAADPATITFATSTGTGVFFVDAPPGKALAVDKRGFTVTCKKVSETTDGFEWYIFGGLADA